MLPTPDTKPGIASAKHVVAGMFIGPMSGDLNFDIASCLSVGASPGSEIDGVKHRHVPLSYQNMNVTDLAEAVDWTLRQVRAERPVLVRSERGLQRPALVVGLAILDLGGHYFDALNCLHSADFRAMTDFRYLQMLRDSDPHFVASP